KFRPQLFSSYRRMLSTGNSCGPTKFQLLCADARGNGTDAEGWKGMEIGRVAELSSYIADVCLELNEDVAPQGALGSKSKALPFDSELTLFAQGDSLGR